MSVTFPDYTQFVTAPGQPALPPGYSPQLSEHGGQSTYLGSRFYQSPPTYGTPQYTYRDLDSMWGKGQDVVLGNKDMLWRLGFMSATQRDAGGFWTQADNNSMREAMAVANKNGVSFAQLYEQQQRNGKTIGASSAGGSGSSGPGGNRYSVSTSSSTSTSVNLSSRESAHAVLSQALANEIGRQPTNAELAQFLRTLNATERANASVSTSSGRSVSDRLTGNSTSTSSSKSTSHSVDPTAEATAFAKGNAALAHERESYQGANYMSVIAKMIGV